MSYSLLYLLFIAIIFLLLLYINIYLSALIYSWLKGAPYVSTSTPEIDKILKGIKIKNGSSFIELGCGDGRVVRQAVKQYKVLGIGVDINPLLILLARIRSKLNHQKNIKFVKMDIFDYPLARPDFVYIYLFPALISKLEKKLIVEINRGATIISHGFKIPYFSSSLIRVVNSGKFKTYFYRKIN